MVNYATTTENNVKTVAAICPTTHTEVDVYHPTPTVTPWDYYGGNHQREYCKVLRNAGLNPLPLNTNKTILRPVGSGPGGSVRFGDNMTPGVYRIAVPHNEVGAAHAAIAKHKENIRNWLDNNGPMPEECR